MWSTWLMSWRVRIARMRGPRVLRRAMNASTASYSVGPEGLETGVGFGLLPHARPDVGIDHVGAARGGLGVVRHAHARSGFGQDLRIRLVAGRAGQYQLEAEAGGRIHPRMDDVVPVADEGDAEAGEIPPALEQREAVGEDLAGVMEIGEPVDGGDAGSRREVDDALMEEGPRHDEIDPAFEVARDVPRRLALPEPDIAGGEVDGGTAELHHADLEGDAGPEARLLEDHGERAPEEERAGLAGTQLRLQPRGELQDGLGLGLRQVGEAQEVAFGVQSMSRPRDQPASPRSRMARPSSSSA